MAIPKHAGGGKARLGFFIPTSQSGISITIPFISDVHWRPSFSNSSGNGRGFNPYADLDDFKAVMEVDYDSGIAFFRVNPSCGASGPKGAGCQEPLDIDLHSSPAERFVRWFGGKDNAVDLQVHGDTVRVEFAIYNANKHLLAPAINGVYEFAFEGGSIGFRPIQNDKYPSWEAYHYLRTGGFARLGQHEASSCGVLLALTPMC